MATKNVFKNLSSGDKILYNDRKEPMTVTGGYDRRGRSELVLAKSSRGKRYQLMSDQGKSKVIATPLGRDEKRKVKNLRVVNR
jgi:predicted house-cleaning NTP pyrophosphatase (Maf/HAM1 superfamily)